MLKLVRWWHILLANKVRRVFMKIAAVSILVTCTAVLLSLFMDLFIQWSKEPSTPLWISERPYLAPALVMAIVMVVAVLFVIYASRKEGENKKGKASNVNGFIQKTEERLDILEKRLPQ